MNDKVETHRLSCPFCNKNINAKGKNTIRSNMSSLQNAVKCEKPLEYTKRNKKKDMSECMTRRYLSASPKNSLDIKLGFCFQCFIPFCYYFTKVFECH
jgi:hypothetical protein